MSLLLIAIAGWVPQPADSEREVCIQEVYQEGHWDRRVGETGLGRQNLNCNAMAKRTQPALWRTLELGTNLQSCPKLRQADGASIDTLPLTCLGWRLPWPRGWNFRLGGYFQLRMFPERDKVESCQHLELLVNESLRAGAGLSVDIAEPGSPSLVEALQWTLAEWMKEPVTDLKWNLVGSLWDCPFSPCTCRCATFSQGCAGVCLSNE